MKCPWCQRDCLYAELAVTKDDIAWLAREKSRSLRILRAHESNGYLDQFYRYKHCALRARFLAVTARYYCALRRFNELQRVQRLHQILNMC